LTKGSILPLKQNKVKRYGQTTYLLLYKKYFIGNHFGLFFSKKDLLHAIYMKRAIMPFKTKPYNCTVLVIIKLTKFADALRLRRCGSGKLIF